MTKVAGPSSQERLSFTIFLALILHAIIILGVTFKSWKNKPEIPPTLQITLAQHNKTEPPDESDYLAQYNQDASGTLNEKAELTTDTRAEFADTQIRHVEPIQQIRTTAKKVHKDRQLVSTTSKNARKSPKKPEETHDQEEMAIEAQETNVTEMQQEIASLQAKLDEQRQRYAKRPRIKTLTSVATRKTVDAEYLYQWQEKIELVGNLNYPLEARRRKIYGNLRLLVSILPNGAVYNTEILQSSGHPLLDESALRIVRLAAPFAPFPPEMLKEVDRLEIIRTWKFEKGGRLVNE